MRYYVESDGHVFLVERRGRLDLPHPDEVPFEIDRIAPLPASEETWFCAPRLGEHPTDWILKDDLVGMPDIDPLVHEAIHASMPRVVVEGVCLDSDGRVLLVKGSRGYTAGRWTLPGGFLRFGETPTDGLIREVREEIGVEARILEPIGVRSKLGAGSRLHWIMVFYRIGVDGELTPDPDEIAEARYVEPTDAVAWLGPEMAAVVRQVTR